MKKILKLLLCFLILTNTGFGTVVKGKIIGYTGGRVTLSGAGLTTVDIASDGSFYEEISMPVQPAYLYILWEDHGRVQMMATESDRIEVVIEPETNEKLKATFSGDRAEWNNYISYSDKEFVYYISHREILSRLSFVDFRQKMDLLKAKLIQLLEKVSDEELKRTERTRLNNQFTSFLFFHYWAKKSLGIREKAEPEFVSFVRSIDPGDKNNLDAGLTESRLKWECDVWGKPETNENIRYLEVLKRLVKDPKLVDQLAYRRMQQYLCGGDKDLEQVYSLFLEVCTDSSMIRELQPQYRVCKTLLPGLAAPDFVMKDTLGVKYHLRDLQGKYLYIDIWATWCTPCKMEIPHLKRLCRQFEGDNRIDFISLSIDGNEHEWKRMLRKDKPEWKQFIVPREDKREFSKLYGIGGIPRFIIIDANGKIVDIDAKRPSDKELVSDLKKYLDNLE